MSDHSDSRDCIFPTKKAGISRPFIRISYYLVVTNEQGGAGSVAFTIRDHHVVHARRQ
jgi:hypothetical protein